MTTSTKTADGVHSTPITKLASALITLGCSLRPKDPVTNTYSEDRPYDPKKPGHVFYHFNVDPSKSLSGKSTPQTLTKAWDENVASEKLDQCFAELSKLVTQTGSTNLMKKFREIEVLLPEAIMCYMKACLENRERILDLWRKATPMAFVKRSDHSFVLVNANASRECKRHLGVIDAPVFSNQ